MKRNGGVSGARPQRSMRLGEGLTVEVSSGAVHGKVKAYRNRRDEVRLIHRYQLDAKTWGNKNRERRPPGVLARSCTSPQLGDEGEVSECRPD